MKAIFAALFVSVSLPAQAAVVDVVISGNIADQANLTTDERNIFLGALISGAAYTATFTYDTELGTRSTSLNGEMADFLSGNTENGLGVPVTASLLVGAITHFILGASGLSDVRDSGLLYVVPRAGDPVFPPDEGVDTGNPQPNLAKYGAFAKAYDASFNIIDTGLFDFSFSGAPGTFPDSLEQDYSLFLRPDPNNSSSIPNGYGSWISSYQDRNLGTYVSSYAALSVSRVTVAVRPDPSPVPLPASMPLLAAALILTALLRQRRAGNT